jgi:rod shape-determining protein MreC
LEHFERKKRRFDSFSMQSYRLLGVALVAGAVMFVDLRYPQWVEPVRHYALQLFEPVLRLLSYPERIYNVANDSVLSHQQLLQENKLLKSLLLQKSVQMQQVSELKAENMRLLALVESGVNLDDNFIYAQVLSASSQPQQHMILLNKGLREGIKVGYPVLDATGVMGQVVEASHRLSQVMLLPTIVMLCLCE